MYIIRCRNCYNNCSASAETIEKQKEKYDGDYICIQCEEAINKINSPDFNGHGIDKMGNKVMLSKVGFYYHEFDRGRIMPANSPFLGFGGRWFLVETKNETYVTNNIFSGRQFYPILQSKINPDKIYIKSIKQISHKDAKEYLESQELIKKLLN